MLSYGKVAFIILFLKYQVPEGSGYNCSDIDGHYEDHPLVECQPAKFMKKGNLVECFDNYTKYHSLYYSKDYLSLYFI